MNTVAILAVAAGGAVGSLSRYWVSVYFGRLFGLGFPWGTLFINVTASFVLGALAEAFATRWHASDTTRLLLGVGFCGGYSTFSTYSLEVVTLFNRGAATAAVLYAAGSVALSLGAVLAGFRIVRALLT
jgi:CrcB protein